jgi:hypothetical protein
MTVLGNFVLAGVPEEEGEAKINSQQAEEVQ